MDTYLLSAPALNKSLEEFNQFFKTHKPDPPSLNELSLAAMIDHSLLKPETLPREIDQLCREAIEYKFFSVCVNSSYVAQCFHILKDSGIKVCSTVSFPLGASVPEAKLFEIECAINNGAEEVDMVINTGRLINGEYDYFYKEISTIISAVHGNDAVLKVIIETCLLSDKDKAAACIICREAGADFIKTSTGFNKAGASVRDVAMLKFISGGSMLVKASGGIKTLNNALEMIAYGAARIGTSSGVHIINSLRNLKESSR